MFILNKALGITNTFCIWGKHKQIPFFWVARCRKVWGLRCCCSHRGLCRRVTKEEVANQSPDGKEWVKDCPQQCPKVSTGRMYHGCSWSSCLKIKKWTSIKATWAQSHHTQGSVWIFYLENKVLLTLVYCKKVKLPSSAVFQVYILYKLLRPLGALFFKRVIITHWNRK